MAAAERRLAVMSTPARTHNDEILSVESAHRSTIGHHALLAHDVPDHQSGEEPGLLRDLGFESRRELPIVRDGQLEAFVRDPDGYGIELIDLGLKGRTPSWIGSGLCSVCRASPARLQSLSPCFLSSSCARISPPGWPVVWTFT